MFIATNFLSGGNTTTILITYAVLFAIVYFMFIRPNSKKKKEMQKMRESIAVGDKIVTIGGFVGVVESVKEDEVIFNCNGSSLKIKRTAIHFVIEK